MRPPRRLKILNLVYAVRFVPAAEAEAAGASGWCDFDRQEIVLAEGQTHAALADCFLHESMHAIGHAMGVDWSEEEKTVAAMATGLTTFWQSNLPALKWWRQLL